MKLLQERIERDELIILDGGIGSELEKRGVPMDKVAWSVLAMRTNPEMLREIHEDYIRAGADIITTNTFLAKRHVLQQIGLGEETKALNQLAVELARKAIKNAADRPVFTAGAISTATLDGTHPATEEESIANYREQAESLAEAGVDFIMMEMVRDPEQTRYALQAATATGLPVWLSFSCETGQDGRVMVFKRNYTLSELMAAISPAPGTVVSIMHTEIKDTAPALAEVKKNWSGAIGAYPHHGEFIRPHWQFIDTITPENYLIAAQEWVKLGARVVGGCCGIGPDHIRLLKQKLTLSVS